jgi:catechol 2,3-dioxygenase-like lactoylglutathione lyase family enzyme
VDVLSSRIILYPSDFDAALRFYDDVLGLHRAREYGIEGRITGVVYFLGGGHLEVASAAAGVVPQGPVRLWLQVRDIAAEHARLVVAGARVPAPPARRPWGLVEMDVEGPDGVSIRLVEVPEDHPLRRRL